MPDSQHYSDETFAKYDAMRTEDLQQILREDASKPAGEGSDTDALFYIMEVLAKRREECGERISPEEALKSFKSKYYSETEKPFDSESTAVTRKKVNGGGWKRGLVAAVVVICILAVGNSITVNALGSGLWDVIAKWTQETFHFGYAGQPSETISPNPEYANPCSGLQDILNSCGVSRKLVPTWLPIGYAEEDAEIENTPIQRRFVAKYMSGDNTICIRIVDYITGAPSQTEQSEGLLELYSSAGIDYYIIRNEDQLQVVWTIDNYECCITGPLTLSESKSMIDSIGKG